MKFSHRYPMFAALLISIAKKSQLPETVIAGFIHRGMTITRAADNREYAETADFKLMTSAFYAPRASAFLRLQKATVLSFFRSTPSEYRTCRISYSVV